MILHKPISLHDALAYEVRASCWASWVWWSWGRTIAARWFAFKVMRKHRHYLQMLDLEKRVLQRQLNLLPPAGEPTVPPQR